MLFIGIPFGRGGALIHCAIWHGLDCDSDPIVSLLIKHPKVDVNVTGLNGLTPLMWAAHEGNVPMVSELLSCEGIDVRALDLKGMSAVSHAQVETVHIERDPDGGRKRDERRKECRRLLEDYFDRNKIPY